MLTIFTVPRPFTDDTAFRQVNALLSWLALRPRPEIVVIGDEYGIGEVARTMGLTHIPDVRTNEFGTPLVDDVFRIGQHIAKTKLLAYVNTDIVLTSAFVKAAEALELQFCQRRSFLAVGQRYDIPRLMPLGNGPDRMLPDWEQVVERTVAEQGALHQTAGIDYFLFRPPVWGFIPPFALGRWRWDNWLVWSALVQGVPVVDCTGCVLAVHQDHDHSHVQGDTELQRNDALVREYGGQIARIHNATHRLTAGYKLMP